MSDDDQVTALAEALWQPKWWRNGGKRLAEALLAGEFADLLPPSACGMEPATTPTDVGEVGEVRCCTPPDSPGVWFSDGSGGYMSEQIIETTYEHLDTPPSFAVPLEAPMSDEIEQLTADVAKWRFMAMEGSALTEREAVALYDDVIEKSAENQELRAELERTRQAWVDGDDPLCEDVCIVQCKGPCGVSDE